MVGRIPTGDRLLQFDGYVNRRASGKKVLENVWRKGKRVILSLTWNVTIRRFSPLFFFSLYFPFPFLSFICFLSFLFGHQATGPSPPAT